MPLNHFRFVIRTFLIHLSKSDQIDQLPMQSIYLNCFRLSVFFLLICLRFSCPIIWIGSSYLMILTVCFFSILLFWFHTHRNVDRISISIVRQLEWRGKPIVRTEHANCTLGCRHRLGVRLELVALPERIQRLFMSNSDLPIELFENARILRQAGRVQVSFRVDR